MYGLDLFSGIGGITKALEGYVTPVAYCENDRYAQAVLLSRMSNGDIPMAPIWDEVCTLSYDKLPRLPDIIYGGFPCQDISVAGHGAGLGGEQSGLFFEIIRLVDEIRPSFVFLENTTGINVHGLERVHAEFELRNYECRGTSSCASSVGCPMHGHRWFFLAKAKSQPGNEAHKSVVPARKESKTWLGSVCIYWQQMARLDFKIHEADTIGKAHGIPNRVDIGRALDNAVVPAQAREAFERLMGLK